MKKIIILILAALVVTGCSGSPKLTVNLFAEGSNFGKLSLSVPLGTEVRATAYYDPQGEIDCGGNTSLPVCKPSTVTSKASFSSSNTAVATVGENRGDVSGQAITTQGQGKTNICATYTSFLGGTYTACADLSVQ